MASRGTSFVRLRNFVKGLVTIRPPSALENGEAQVAENVDLSQDTVKRRSGWQKTHSGDLPVADKPVTSLYAHYPDDGTDAILATVGTSLIKQDAGAADFATLKSAFAPEEPVEATYQSTQGNVYVAVRYGEDRTSQTLSKWDGSSVTQITDTPAVSLITIFNDALWGSGDSTEPSRVYWSRIFPNQDIQSDSSDGWPATNFVDVFPGDGDQVTGLGKLLQSLVVLKERSIHRISGTQPDDAAVETGDLSVFGQEDQAGCVAPRSVASASNLIVYLNREGLFGFNGVRTKELSEPIRPLFETLNASEIEKSVGFWLDPFHYVIALTTEDSVVPDLIVSMHLQPTLHFTVWTGLEVYSWGKFRFGGEEIPILGTDGAVGRMDANTDDGTPIDWKYVSGVLNLGGDPFAKVVRRGWVEAKVTGDTMDVELLPDFRDNGIVKVVNLSKFKTADESEVRIPLSAFGKAHNWAVKLSGRGTGTAPEVTEVMLEVFDKRLR